MISFDVQDMTCGHCVSAITKAVRGVDKGATVRFNLGQHRVEIDPTEANAQELSDAIKQAGYTPIPVPELTLPTQAPAKAGGCCGCR